MASNTGRWRRDHGGWRCSRWEREPVSKNGGNFVYAKQWGSDFHVVDGRLITGQDPNATASVARAVIKAIEARQSCVAEQGTAESRYVCWR
jgi:putative intracellular protease/amidase